MNLKRPFMTRREFVASSTGAIVASSFARRPLAFGESSQLARAPSRVIIDTDPGVDDALALLLAMRSPELKIEGITPVAGNVPLELTLPKKTAASGPIGGYRAQQGSVWCSFLSQEAIAFQLPADSKVVQSRVLEQVVCAGTGDTGRRPRNHLLTA